MKLRWLIGTFTDPYEGLSLRDRHEISNQATGRMPASSLIWWTLGALVLPALLVIGAGLPFVMRALGLSGRTGPYLIGLCVILVVFWPWSAWVYGHVYVKPVRRALRERGIDLCISCGYDLRGTGEDVGRCPECGAEREVAA